MAYESLKPGEFGAINISKTANGHRARCLVKLMNGNLVERERRGKTEREADRRLKEAIAKEIANSGSSGLLSYDSTVAAAASVWHRNMQMEAEQEIPRIKDSSITNNIKIYKNKIHPLLGKSLLYQVTPQHCYNVICQIAKTDSADTAKRAKGVLRQIFGTAIFNNALTKNPMDEVKSPLLPRHDVEILSDFQVGYLRNLFWQSELDRLGLGEDGKKRSGPRPTFHLPVLYDVALGTAIRHGEILALRWCDLDEYGGKPALYLTGTMIPPKEKGKEPYRQEFLKMGNLNDPKHRIVFLPKFAYESLMFIRPNHTEPTDYIFQAQERRASTGPTPHAESNVNSQIRRVLKRYSVSDYTFSPQILRRTVSSMLIDKTGDNNIANRLLGHSIPSDHTVTGRYYHFRGIVCPDVTDLIQEYVDSCGALVGMPTNPTHDLIL